MSTLPGYLFKLARSAELYEFIDQKQSSWADGKVGYEVNPGTFGNDTWDVFAWKDVEEPDPMFGVWVGELVHDIRSALDHLVNELVRENGGQPGRNTQFPIYGEEDDWIRAVEQSTGRRSSPVKGISDDHLLQIKEVQPFHLSDEERKGHPLWQLQRMSNVDKHQTLHVARLRASKPTVTYEPPGFNEIDKCILKSPGTMITAGQVIGRVRPKFVKAPPSDVQVKLRLQGVMQLVFMQEDSPPIAGVHDLGKIIQFARDFVMRVRPDTDAKSAS